MPVRFQFVPGQAPDLFDLPWSTPLEQWHDARLVQLARGASRHVVRFVKGADDDDRIFALKETTESLARREYAALRFLKDDDLPVVDAVGIVTGRQRGAPGERSDLPAVLITRYLDFSLPYRYLFSRTGGGGRPGIEGQLIDAAVVLLCRLHLEGFYWGDCSLNNVLFRRDAGSLMAYLVDAETTEHHQPLSSGLRQNDVELAKENFAGGLLDLQAADRLPRDIDPFATAEQLDLRYKSLWTELTSEEHISASDRHEVDRRIRRLNDLGFDVGELIVEHDLDRAELKVRPALVEEGHHANELRRLTGLDVQENQARHLLNDISAFRAHLEHRASRDVPLAVAAARWIAEIYEPAISAVPAELRSKREPAQLFHWMLMRRYDMADELHREVFNVEALESLMRDFLPNEPDERLLELPITEELEIIDRVTNGSLK
ncbi:MAG: DUF4032 domain-containing protein [Actinomycetota bacterium]|nr:DUF4032 domain-containing protein [Actinomycetota bacterium]